MKNTINEYLNYLKENSLENDLSDYFTSYISENHSDLYKDYINPIKDNNINVPELTNISNPIINTSGININNPNKLNIKSPINNSINTNSSSEINNLNIKSDKNNISKYIMNFFQNKGLSKEQSAGIAGNLFEESGFNPTAVGDKHLATPSEGIAQWREKRLDNLKNFAKSKNSNYKDLNIQLEFLWNELNTTEKNSLNYLKKANNPIQAAQLFANNFERMKTYNKKRENNALYFYKLLS